MDPILWTRETMTEVGQRAPRIRDPQYLKFLQGKPCCVCGAPPPSDPAHIRMSSTVYGKRMTGAGEKPSDRFAVPLCRPVLGVRQGCHKSQHSMNEGEWWRNHGINPFEIAIRLYADGGNPDVPQTKRKKRTTITPKGMGPKIPSRPFDKQKRPFR